ncbi:MAG: hypothetical protein AAFP07_14355 [Cyanobacteria bacterium J06606_4]
MVTSVVSLRSGLATRKELDYKIAIDTKDQEIQTKQQEIEIEIQKMQKARDQVIESIKSIDIEQKLSRMNAEEVKTELIEKIYKDLPIPSVSRKTETPYYPHKE